MIIILLIVYFSVAIAKPWTIPHSSSFMAGLFQPSKIGRWVEVCINLPKHVPTHPKLMAGANDIAIPIILDYVTLLYWIITMANT